SAKHEEDSDRPAQVGTPSILDNEHIYSKADTRNKARKIAGFVSNLKHPIRGAFALERVKGSNGLEPVAAGNFGHPVDGRKGGKRAAVCSEGTAVRPVSDGRRPENAAVLCSPRRRIATVPHAFRLGVQLKKQHCCFFLKASRPGDEYVRLRAYRRSQHGMKQ
ncbi:MAG: hypothetical protein IKH31_05255, partial [Clostridia bacterium]|nr:hypothetical protein [Clostridia bacterium]